MATLDLLTTDGSKRGSVELPAALFEAPVSEHAVHAAVVAFEANQRQGNASAKGRSEVNRSGRKHHRQKGSGMARRGTVTTSLLRGGGVAFGHPKPRSYRSGLTKGMKRRAFFSALSDKGLSGHVRVVEDFEFEAPSTKSFAALLQAIGLGGDEKVLFVMPANDPVLVKSCRNLPGIEMTTAATANTYSVVAADVLVLTPKSVDALGALHAPVGESEAATEGDSSGDGEEE